MNIRLRQHLFVLALLAALVLLAYWPLFSQPLLEDDYPNIEMARRYGAAMLTHPTGRFRFTSYVLAFLADRLFGCSPAALHGVSIALHVLATWLVYAFGGWRPIGWRVAAVGAGFFAVYEGHQEAVMWYSAASEELMFIFGLLAFLFWARFLRAPERTWLYGAALVCFLLALASKESAPILAPLLLLPLFGVRASLQGFLRWLVFAALAAGDALLIFTTPSTRLEDGSFSLTAPVWITWPESYARLLWFWGLLAVLVLLWIGARRLLLIGGVWIGLSLVPYSFLTYMHRVPSRQTYLASAGLAWIVGAAFWELRPRLRHSRRLVVACLVLLVLGSNIGYLWIKKRQQFLARAAPSEALISMARHSSGPIYVRCYPGPRIVAESAVFIGAGRPASILRWKPDPAVREEFCWK